MQTSQPNNGLTESEREQIISKYRNLLRLCRPYIKPGDSSVIRKAFNIALSALSGEKTKLGDPGIFYPMDLTEILAVETGLGTNSLVSTLLLHAFLSGQVTPNTILRDFDPQVINMLQGVKKINSIKTGKTAIQSENFIRFLLSISGDARTLLIKMADTLYHMRILHYLDQAVQMKVANDAYFLYAPIAHRLGLYHIKTELENSGMKFLHPDEYQTITNKLKESVKARDAYINAFLNPIIQRLHQQKFHYEIKSRTKSVHSIWKKMVKQQLGFDEVYDLLAIRIILDTPRENEKEACWKVYSIVSDIYPPNPSRLRDWISVPKTSGYESLHTTVKGPLMKWVEVQIRSRRMDEIAEMGHAAHWKYKESRKEADSPDWLLSIRNLLENPESSNARQARLEAEQAEIYVFTPDGDLKSMPRGATVLDFAFEIHTNLGLQCTGAKVNGKINPIKYVLQNGDEVAVLTAKNQKPKADWLSFLKTPRARQKVKRALKEEELKEAELGKEALMRKFRNWKIQFSDDNILKVLKALKYKTPIELYHAIATEKLDALVIRDIFQPPQKTGLQGTPEPGIREDDRKTLLKKDDFVFLDQNLAGINYTLASCCNPIFGDDVFGFVTISKGITIHRKSCPNAKEMMEKYDYRIIQVKWREASSSGSFHATIRISGIDQLGIVSTLSDVISNELKVNMRSISVETNNGVFEGTIKIMVSDTRHLDTLLHKLTRVKGVLKAIRLE
ncbi:MAG TPA: RelA/SpoT family protein [Bacteroidales bacterium]|nr:RelA/SpoT family protein [Bacteroidales bacterium]HSA42715.1 RelA/SpoT family protein [Bacteroidales bacterium]